MNAVHARLGAGLVVDGPHAEALQEAAAGNAVRELFNRYAAFDLTDIGLTDDKLVEGNGLWGELERFWPGPWESPWSEFRAGPEPLSDP